MTGRARRGAAWAALPPGPGEPTLDQLLADPIVQQLMRRDRIDESTTRRLFQRAALARTTRILGSIPPGSCGEDDPITILWLLHETARLWRKRYEREIRARIPGMTRARCAVLVHLAHYEGVNPPGLARALNIKPTTLLRLLGRLEGVGFIARMPDPRDPDAYVLALTAEALPMIERIYGLARRVYDEAQLGISNLEANQLLTLLHRLKPNLSARPSQMPPGEPVRRCGGA
ncbi:MAG TPA: MarR family winged helix-turn-helix transcriptional regulator [Verrucomicrobiae bacterium]|jgi:MarR family transcriptional regulator, transcriptional regulator for hemolysin|nr:MarR family winged helix-turn-helix transcriptional regulator [Verrucomicrobiae bacterium]